MKKLKTFLIVILCLVFVCAFPSCTDDGGNTGETFPAAEETEKAEQSTGIAADNGEETAVGETEIVTGYEEETSDGETDPVSDMPVRVTEESVRESTKAAKMSGSDYGDWGVAMSFEPGAGNKGRLIIEQSSAHGKPEGELMTGEKYIIQRYDNGAWIECNYINGIPQWIMLAYLIPADDVYMKEIDYSYIYGDLMPGRYRICKEIRDSGAQTGNSYKTFYAEFTIE